MRALLAPRSGGRRPRSQEFPWVGQNPRVLYAVPTVLYALFVLFVVSSGTSWN